TVSAPWPTATNWALNSQWRTLDGSTAEPSGWTAADGAEDSLSIETGAGDVETGAQSLGWLSAGAGETLTMDPVALPSDRWGGGTTAQVGVRYKASNANRIIFAVNRHTA